MMKQFIYSLIILLIFISFQSNAQDRPIDKIFQKFKGADEVSTMVVDEVMFSLFDEYVEEKDMNIDDIVDGIVEVRLLQFEPKDKGKIASFANQLGEMIPFDSYKEIMNIKETSEKVKILIKKNGKNITELLMFVVDKNEVILVNIFGTLNLKNIMKLSTSLNLKGLKNLDTLETKKKK